VSLNSAVVGQLDALMQDPRRVDASADFLSMALRLLAKWRSQLIANTIIARDGTVVQSGPFKGMHYVEAQTEGGLAPRLLGTYESELHPHIEKLIERGLEFIVDIGCAEGYYAVGFALAAPRSVIHAFDISEKARNACRSLAARNGVEDRVRINGEFRGQDFAGYPSGETLIFIDAEGAEDDLIDPERYPALRGHHLIIETHPGARAGVTERLRERFAQSHNIETLLERAKPVPEGSWLNTMPTLDQYLATWEWRGQITPWLIMSPICSANPTSVES
jgi:hypothetical protein